MRFKHAAVVYNPLKIRIDLVRRAVADEERRRGWGRSRWYETSGEDSGRSAAEAALAGRPAMVMVVGGDGTVRTVVEAVYEHRIPIALLPSGTGNLLARNLGIPLGDVEACVAIAFAGSIRAIDIGLAEIEHEDGRRSEHVFLVMAGIGLDAEMAEHTSALAKKHLGWLAYISPIARSVLANRLFHLDYRVDHGRVRSTTAHTIIVGNCGTLTGNMLLIPNAVVDDGLLDVVMMRPKGRFEWARIGTRLTVQGISRRSRLSRKMFQGAPDLRALAYAQGRQFEARFDTPHGIQLDGDGFGDVVRARISVLPGALNLLATPETGVVTPSCASLPGG
ncbi:MAG: diacylglycerol/lipid kinase family protein [Leucobacter sp.]